MTAGLAQDAAAGTALVHLDLPRWFRGGEQVPAAPRAGRGAAPRAEPAIEYQRDDRDAEAARPRVVGPLGLVNKAGRWYLVAAVGVGASARSGSGGGRVVVSGRVGS